MINQYFHIMPSRLTEIKEAMVGFDSTQTFLIGYNQTQGYFPLGLRDDMGMGYFCTLLHHYAGISVEMAYPCLLSILIISGWWFAWNTYRHHSYIQPYLFLFHVLNTAVAIFAFYRGDVYAVGYTAAMIVYYCLLSNWITTKTIYVKWFICLVYLICLELIRNKTGLAAIMSLILLVWLNHKSIALSKKGMLSVFALLIFSLNTIWINQLSERRNEWFANHAQTNIDAGSGHPFWHSVYIGLGIISNQHGIEYRDEIAFERAKKIGGDSLILCSKPYEAIIKKEFLLLLQVDPWFVIKALGLKSMIVIFLFSVFLLPILYNGKWRRIIAISPFLLMYAAAGILVYPRINYMLGALACTLFVAVHLWIEPFSIDNR